MVATNGAPESGFPPAPLESMDWENIGFRVHEVAGHIESHYTKSTGRWSEPKWVADPYLKIHCLAPGLNYGQHAFEGIKAYRSQDGKINVFRPVLNAERMQRSNEALSMPEIPTAHFLRCVELAVGLNAAYVPPYSTGGAMYIRPLSFGSSGQLGMNPPEEFMFLVQCIPTGVYHGTAPIPALVLEDFDRTAPRGSGNVKVGGNYGPTMKWSQRAYAEGYGITLHLDSQTRSEIDEFSTAGFIGLKESPSENASGEKQITLVVPDSPCVILSSTSTAAFELAQSFGWHAERRRIPVTELGQFVEVCAAGTAAALVPVRSIDMRSSGERWEYRGMDGKSGPLVAKLLENLRGIQNATLPDPFGWRHEVSNPQPWIHQQEKINRSNDPKTVNGGGIAVDKLP